MLRLVQAIRRPLCVTYFALVIAPTWAQIGSLDPSFVPSPDIGSGVGDVILQPDGKVLISTADFGGIVRLNADGSMDPTFNTSNSGITSIVSKIALQPDGKVLAGTPFGLSRLNTDGSLDASFTVGMTNNYVQAIVPLDDGKILIGGSFTEYNGIAIEKLAKLNSDGSLDASFNPGEGIQGDAEVIFDMIVQLDGKIVIVGAFYLYSGVARDNIARLNSDGSLDVSFDPGTGFGGTPYTLALQPDGKILIGGYFAVYNGMQALRIVRINSDGTLDSAFTSEAGVNSIIYKVVIQSDGYILIGGQFETYNATTRNNIARLHADGSLDPIFNPGAGANSPVGGIAIQPDGNVLIGGSFTNYDGTPMNHIARLLNDIGTQVENVGIDRSSGLQVYPNPTEGTFVLDIPTNNHHIQLEVTDATGRVILAQNVNIERQMSLLLNGPPGIYFITLFTEGNRDTIKLVKK